MKKRPAPVAPTAEAINYQHFGPFGPDFQALHDATLAAWADRWEERRSAGEPKFRVALQSLLDRTRYWFERAGTLLRIQKGHLPPLQFLTLWSRFRSSFRPSLTEGEELSSRRSVNEGMIKLLNAREFAYGLPAIAAERRRLNPICHGPYSGRQFQYLLRLSPLLEVAAGSGYLTDQLSLHGADVIGFDTNQYELARSDTQDWTARAIRQGRLIIGDTDLVTQLGRGRTRLLNWPEPGAAYPADALSRYAAVGGHTFVLKVGAFFGYRVGHDAPPGASRNVAEFLELLARDWKEINDPERPPYVPAAYGNNMWVFRRR